MVDTHSYVSQATHAFLGMLRLFLKDINLITGFGSVGTFLEGPIIGIVSSWYGWSGMFYFMIGLSLVGTLSIARAAAIHNRKVRTIPDSEPIDLEMEEV